MLHVVYEFSMYLGRYDRIGSVIYDEDKVQFNRLLQKEIMDFRVRGISVGDMRHPDRLSRVLNNINFCPSHMSWATACRFCVQRRLAEA